MELKITTDRIWGRGIDIKNSVYCLLKQFSLIEQLVMK